MSEPSREHVGAVAQCLAAMPDRLAAADRRARHLLTSTDPAVLDAMQDALVRAGRSPEWQVWQLDRDEAEACDHWHRLSRHQCQVCGWDVRDVGFGWELVEEADDA